MSPGARFPDRWRTARLEIRDAAESESEEIRAVYNACAATGRWDPTFYEAPAGEILELLKRSGRSSPDGDFRVQAFRAGGSGPILGYFHFTIGAPKPDLAWISMFVLPESRRGQGYGREVVEGFAGEIRKLGSVRALWLKVYLKNWTALRFWVENGFRGIVEFRGDRAIDEKAEACLVLERSLA